MCRGHFESVDTVPHSAIVPALGRLGTPTPIAEYMGETYKDCRTVIKTGSGGSDVEVEFRRGVKQGDPMSPTLWNAVMDPAITELSKTRGVQVRRGQPGSTSICR